MLEHKCILIGLNCTESTFIYLAYIRSTYAPEWGYELSNMKKNMNVTEHRSNIHAEIVFVFIVISHVELHS